MSKRPEMEFGDDYSPLRTRASRRSFLKGMGLAAGATVMLPDASRAAEAPATPPEIPGLKEFGRGPQEIVIHVNGQPKKLTVEPRTTLLEALRLQLGLTGAKEVCDRGSCGACTVHVEGKAVTSCMTLAVEVANKKVTTIEGLVADPKYGELVKSYCDHDGAQCGYCIPGFVMRSAALMDEVKVPLDGAAVREGLAGNICRCGTYSKIFDAMVPAGGKK